MKKMALGVLLATSSYFTWSGAIDEALAQTPTIAPLTVKVDGFANNQPIPSKFAYCMRDGKGHTKNGGNISPTISWSGAPAATQSYALIVVDRDVPTSFDTANKGNQTIPDRFPRRNFYHWVLVNIPANIGGLFEGKNSKGITRGGKPTGKTDYGVNGLNGYGFGGYDGPCPPWNDERRHHYHFIVYALDIQSLHVPDPVEPALAESAMAGHILAQGEFMGTYTTNKDVPDKDTAR